MKHTEEIITDRLSFLHQLGFKLYPNYEWKDAEGFFMITQIALETWCEEDWWRFINTVENYTFNKL